MRRGNDVMSPKRWFRRGLLAATLAACGSTGPTAPGSPSSPARSIRISPLPLPLTIGNSARLTVIAFDGGLTLLDTAAIAWSSSNLHVASVSSNGAVMGVGAGTATISARDGALVDTVTVRVTASPLAALEVIGPTHALGLGQEFQVFVAAADQDGQLAMPPAVTWTSSRVEVATVSGTGLVTTHALGATTVAVAAGSFHAEVPIVVGSISVTALELTGPSAPLAVGATFALTAKARLVDGTTITWLPLTWSSFDTTVATVSDAGVLTARAPGIAEITATDGTRLALVFAVIAGGGQLTAAILPSSSGTLLVAPGQLLQLTPIEYYSSTPRPTRPPAQVSWTSDDDGIARVSAGGVVTGVAPGSTTIRAMIDQHPAERAVQVVATAGTATIRMISLANDYPAVTMHPNTGATAILPYGGISEQTVPAGPLQLSLDGIPPLTSFFAPAIFDVQVFTGFLPPGTHHTFVAVNNTMYASFAGPAAIAWLTDRTEPVPADSAAVRMLLATDGGYNVYFTRPGESMNLLALRGCYLDWPYGYTEYADQPPGDFDIVLQGGKFGTSGPEVARFHVSAPAGRATTFLVTGKDVTALHVTPVVDN